MTSYSLREFRTNSWFRFIAWLRIGLAVAMAVLLAGETYGIYVKVTAGRLGSTQVIGTILIFLICGLILSITMFMRPPAVELVISEVGVCLVLDNGVKDFRPWESPRTRIRGRFTAGADDFISRGQPVWSIYGPMGGLSESFIPGPAFEVLLSTAKAHGFYVTETSGHPGWTLYTIALVNP